MTLDRADASAAAIAVAGHGAILAALIWGLGSWDTETATTPPAMEVSFVEDVGLQSSAPTLEPAAQGYAPELGPPEEAAPTPAAEPVPQPAERTIPQPTPSPALRRAAPPAQRQPAPTPQRNAGTALANRGSRLGPDLLKGIGSDPASRSPQPSGAVMSRQATADIGSAILRQVQPCANRQRSPGPGAERIRVTIRLRLNRDGSLVAPPAVTGRTGVDDGNSRYAERVDDLAINTFTACSPLRGLPAELYDVPNGWRDFRLRYSLPR
jgi:hypothetical protein